MKSLTTRRRISILCILSLLTATWLLYDKFIEDGNFNIIIPHTLYRSATLSHHEWKEILREHPPFKSVLNLRGIPKAGSGDDWYTQEESLSAKSGINFYTLSISANHEPDLTTMETMVEMMRAAPKPLLVHCKQGADRTGLALALYEYAIEGKSATEADQQLSIRYGHFPWITSRTSAMDKAFANYVKNHPHAN